MITTKQLERAKKELHTTSRNIDDRILIAYEWLDAQLKQDRLISQRADLEQLITGWGGKSIARNDIELAAQLHDEISGRYPIYNINYRFVLPAAERLRGLGQTMPQTSNLKLLLENYRSYERVQYSAGEEGLVAISYLTEEFPASQYDWLDFCSRNNSCKCYYCVYGR